MNTKSKGNIGESMILAEFTKRGIQCSIPWGDNARYDLIAEFNGRLNKIQIKYCNSSMTVNNSFTCRCSSSTNHTTNKKLSGYKNDVDFIAVYIEPWNECYLIPIDKCGKTFTIRKEIPKNNQSNIHLADDYTFDKILCVETLHAQSDLQSTQND